MKRLRRILVWAVLLVLAVGAAGYASLRQYEQAIIAEVDVKLREVQEYRPDSTCDVYDRNGELIDSFYVERRTWMPIEEMPDILWQAVIASEDRRFMQHVGVDPIGIARALVSNIQAGTVTEGGSTLTQQLVKNLFLTTAQTYERKAREAVIAYHMEKRLTKMEILELYLNYIYLGSGNYGVEAAAQDYFGISVHDIDAGQAALLAALIPAPSNINPLMHPELATQKRAEALDDLVEVGILTQDQADSFKDDPIVSERSESVESVEHPAYVTSVRREVRRLLGNELPFELGLQVHTGFDPVLQAVVDQAVLDALKGHVERQGAKGVRRTVAEEDRAAFRTSDEVPMTLASGDCVEAMVSDDRTFVAGPHEWEWPRWKWNVRVAEYSDQWVTLRQRAGPGDVVSLCMDDDGEMQLDHSPWAQAGAVVIEHETGAVVALSGGLNVPLEGFVRATQATRQPGSSFKPYVYATALMSGKSQMSSVMDTPIYFPGSSWSPDNPGGYHGKVSLRRALTHSYNAPPVRLALAHGVDNLVELTHAMGVMTPLRGDLTIALGSSEVSVMDQAIGYSTIARNGVHIDPVFIQRLIDVNGDLVGEAGGPVLVQGEEVVHLPGARTQVLDRGVAAELADMLHNVVESGTGRRARSDTHWIAGKTGTTNRATDTWFVGFTPTHTIATWVGTDDFIPLGKHGEGGSRTALPAFTDIVAALPEVTRPPDLPDEAISVATWSGWLTMDRRHVPDTVLRTRDDDLAPLEPFLLSIEGW